MTGYLLYTQQPVERHRDAYRQLPDDYREDSIKKAQDYFAGLSNAKNSSVVASARRARSNPGMLDLPTGLLQFATPQQVRSANLATTAKQVRYWPTNQRFWECLWEAPLPNGERECHLSQAALWRQTLLQTLLMPEDTMNQQKIYIHSLTLGRFALRSPTSLTTY